MGTDWKGLLGGIAPALATALGGPAAGTAVRALSQKLFGRPDAAESDIASALTSATPEQIEAIKKLDQEFVLSLVDKAVELEKIEADDRANARARETALHDPTVSRLAYILTAGFFSMLLALAVWHVPSENRDILISMTGVLGTAWIGAISYYFGTSSGSRSKEAVIGKIANAK